MSCVKSSRVSIPSYSQDSTSSTKIIGLVPSPAVASFSLVTGTSSPLVNPRQQGICSTPENSMEMQLRILNEAVKATSAATTKGQHHRPPRPVAASHASNPLPPPRVLPKSRCVYRTASDPRQHLRLEAEDHGMKLKVTAAATDPIDSSSSIVRPSSIKKTPAETATTAISRQILEEKQHQLIASAMPLSTSSVRLSTAAVEQTATRKAASKSSRQINSKSECESKEQVVAESNVEVTLQAKLASKESKLIEANQVTVKQPTTRSNKKKQKQTAKVQTTTTKKKQSKLPPTVSEQEKLAKARMIRLKEHQLIAVEEERIDLSCRSHSKPKKDDDEQFADELHEWFSDNKIPSMSKQVNILTSEGGDRFIEFDSLLRLITLPTEKTTSYENYWNRKVIQYMNEDLSKKDRREALLFEYYHLQFKGRSVSCLQESAFVDFIDVMNKWLVNFSKHEVVRILARHIDLVCWRVFEPQPESDCGVVLQQKETNKLQIDKDTAMKVQREKTEVRHQEAVTKSKIGKTKDEVMSQVVTNATKSKRSTPYVAKRTPSAVGASTSEPVAVDGSKSKKRKRDALTGTTENRSRDEPLAAIAVTSTANKKQRVDHVHTDERKQCDDGVTEMKADEIKQETFEAIPPVAPHHVDATIMIDLSAPWFSLQLSILRSSPHYDKSAVLKCISQGQTEFKQLYDYVTQQPQ